MGTTFEREKKEKRNGSNNRPVRCIETGVVYSSCIECARAMGLDPSSLTKVCRGKLKKTKGYHFEYYKEENEND